MSLFSGIEDAEVFGQGKFFSPDFQGVVAVGRTVMIDSKHKPGISFFVAEMVVETTNDEEIHPVGDRCTWLAGSDKPSFMGNVKGFLQAALCTQQIGEADAELCISAEQPLKGVKLELQTVGITTRAGKPFTKHNWRGMPDQFEAAPEEG